jgi:DNA topoisomerase VI subunit B
VESAIRSFLRIIADGNTTEYERTIDEYIKTPPKEIRPHLKSADFYVLSGFLMSGKGKVEEALKRSFEGVGPKLAYTICKKVGILGRVLPFSVEEKNEVVEKLFEVINESKFRVPSVKCLYSIPKEVLMSFVCTGSESDSYYDYEVLEHNGHPLILQVALAYFPDKSRNYFYRFANKIPFVMSYYHDVMWRTIDDFNFGRYKFTKDNLSFAISVVSTSIPFSETSKEYLVKFNGFDKIFIRILRRAGRQFKKIAKKVAKAKEAEKKFNYMMWYLQRIAGELDVPVDILEANARKYTGHKGGQNGVSESS